MCLRVRAREKRNKRRKQWEMDVDRPRHWKQHAFAVCRNPFYFYFWLSIVLQCHMQRVDDQVEKGEGEWYQE